MKLTWSNVDCTMVKVERDDRPTLIADQSHPEWDLFASQEGIAPYIVPAATPIDPKMVGVEFNGVMCSATKEDQSALVAVMMSIQIQGAGFPSTVFKFENGNEITITLANYQAFIASWLPFRQSFFSVQVAE